MRDPERIDRMIEKVRELWKKQPDARLLQLLINSASMLERVDDDFLYFLEDDRLEEGIDACGSFSPPER